MDQELTFLERVEAFQNSLIAHATGGIFGKADEYSNFRKELLAQPQLRPIIPQFVRTCRDLPAFWEFIKGKFSHWKERRFFIREEFSPLLQALESQADAVAVVDDNRLLDNFDAEHVQAIWQRALDRKTSDPEGAITLARTLLESVCKHVLDDRKITYSETTDLPKLYGLTSAALKLGPSQHTEKVFKQILGGCASVVEGLGALRNKVGDAHGSGRKRVKPAVRHAELAVNLAGSMTIFLVQTWKARKADSES